MLSKAGNVALGRREGQGSFFKGRGAVSNSSPVVFLAAIGAYRDEKLKPYIFESVQEAERMMVDDRSLNKEYLPILGHRPFRRVAMELCFGKDHPVLQQRRVASSQTLGGTGAVRLAFDLLHHILPGRRVYIPNPTWGNHKAILHESDFPDADVAEYPYLTAHETGEMPSLNVDGILDTFQRAPEGSIILLHACGHNPTGLDPSLATWQRIADVCAEREHVVVFDMAYQGFVSGEPDRDAAAVRMFADRLTPPVMVCQSFSKNFGLYCERVGALHVVCGSEEEAAAAESHLEGIVRAMYSNPPAHGARVVHKILTHATLRSQWRSEMKAAAERVNEMRAALYAAILERRTPGAWEALREGGGLFAMLGLTPEQCRTLVDEHHVYLLDNGRISLAGLNHERIAPLADLLHEMLGGETGSIAGSEEEGAGGGHSP